MYVILLPNPPLLRIARDAYRRRVARDTDRVVVNSAKRHQAHLVLHLPLLLADLTRERFRGLFAGVFSKRRVRHQLHSVKIAKVTRFVKCQ